MNRFIVVLWSVAFQLLHVMPSFTGEILGQEESIAMKEFKNDKQIAEAIVKSRTSIHVFKDLVSQGLGAGQSRLTAVAVQDVGGTKVPFGVSVESIDENGISGKAVENSIDYVVSDRYVSVSLDEIIDWYYYDSFEMIGGHLFKELLSRAPPRVRDKVVSCHPNALLFSKKPLTDKERFLAQAVINERIDEIALLVQERPQLVLDDVRYARPSWGKRGSAFIVTAPFPELAVCTGSRSFLKKLEARGWLINKPDAKMPLLHIASSAGNLEAVQVLLDRGDSPSDRDSSLRTALFCAVEFDNLEVTTHLLSLGCDPNIPNNGGYIALHYVERLAIAEELVARGANINAVSDSGYSVVESLAENGQINIVKYLVSLGAKSSRRIQELADSFVPPDEVNKRFSPFLYGETEVKDSKGLVTIPPETNYGTVLPVKTLSPITF